MPSSRVLVGAMACSFALAGALSGCAQILGADNYTTQSPSVVDDAGSDAADAEAVLEDGSLAFAPKPPAYTDTSCVACINESCRAELRACESDESCADHLAQARALPSDGYPSRELLLGPAQDHWTFDRGESNGWDRIDGFQTCTRRHCLERCEFGRDFSCTGKFEWPATYPKTAEVRFRVKDYQKGATAKMGGFRFRGCPLTTSCTSPMAEGLTEDQGFIALPVDFSRRPPVIDLPEFNGVWLVDGRDDYPLFKLQSTRPYLDKDYAVLPFFDKPTASLTRISSGTIAARSGTLIVVPYDCRDDPAKRVKLEVWRPVEGGFQPCTECTKPLYSDDGMLPDSSRSEYGSRGINAIVNVPADNVGDLMLVIRDSSTREPISALRRVGVQVDEFLVITMYPASRSQLAGLPPEVRRPP